MVEISTTLTYIAVFLDPLDVKDKRVIEELAMQASMISVPGASSVETLQTDV